MSYVVQEHLRPRGLRGISDHQIAQHWALYAGYVTNVNALLDDLAKVVPGSRTWAELKRRAGFEFNGMILHELYFGNLMPDRPLDPRGAFAGAVVKAWGSLEAWETDFAKTAAMRGIGWVIVYHDPQTDQLFNWWVTEHEVNHPSGFNPILVLDVFEHAYMVDYGTPGRAEYVKAFAGNVAWDVVDRRLLASKDGRMVDRFGTAGRA